MNMIERVARALCITAGHNPDGPACDVYIQGDPDAIYPWAGYRREARAAIEAMREPAEVMVVAGEWPASVRRRWRLAGRGSGFDLESGPVG